MTAGVSAAVLSPSVTSPTTYYACLKTGALTKVGTVAPTCTGSRGRDRVVFDSGRVFAGAGVGGDFGGEWWSVCGASVGNGQRGSAWLQLVGEEPHELVVAGREFEGREPRGGQPDRREFDPRESVGHEPAP